MKEWRAAVERIYNPKNAILIKLLYLGAFRPAEVACECSSYDLQHGKSKPYGNFLSYSLADYEEAETKEKALLLTAAVAKRLKIKKELEEAIGSDDTKKIEEALMRFRQFDLLAEWKAGRIELSSRVSQQLLGKLFFCCYSIQPCKKL